MYLTKKSFCVIHCELYLLGEGVTKVHIFVSGGAIVSFSCLRRRWKEGQRTRKRLRFRKKAHMHGLRRQRRQNVHSLRLDSIRLTVYG